MLLISLPPLSGKFSPKFTPIYSSLVCAAILIGALGYAGTAANLNWAIPLITELPAVIPIRWKR